MAPAAASYVLVTPMKNESDMLDGLFASVLSQTTLPILWILVDDSSSDESLQKARDLASSYPWIQVVSAGLEPTPVWLRYGAVVSTGIEKALERTGTQGQIIDVIGVLDADTIVDSAYFEKLSTRLVEIKGAIASGMIDAPGQGYGYPSQALPRGCGRLYRLSFLREVGGFPVTPAPDTVLEIKARNRGFTLVIDSGSTGTHRRGSSLFRDPVGHRNLGYAHYSLGTDLTSFLLVSISLLLRCGTQEAVAFAEGYFGGRKQKQPRIDDPEIREYFSSSLKRLVVSKDTKAVIKTLLRAAD